MPCSGPHSKTAEAGARESVHSPQKPVSPFLGSWMSPWRKNGQTQWIVHKPYAPSFIFHLLHPKMKPSPCSLFQSPSLVLESPGRKGSSQTSGWVKTFLLHFTWNNLRDPHPITHAHSASFAPLSLACRHPVSRPSGSPSYTTTYVCFQP